MERRSVLCYDCCVTRTIGVSIADTPEADEQRMDILPSLPKHTYSVQGCLSRHYYCDWCAKEMAPGERVVAESTWTGADIVGDTSWTKNYIKRM